MKRLLAVVGALAIAVPTALAVPPASVLKASPSKVTQGHKVKVFGTVFGCSGPVTIYSKAFKGSTTKNFAGVPAVFAKVSKGNFSKKVKIQSSIKPGKYHVGGRCGGGNFGGTSFKVKKPPTGGGPGFY